MTSPEPLDAEIVETVETVETTAPAPTRADVTGYTDAGVPTFDHVRDVINRRTAVAIGSEELARGTAAGDEAERRLVEHEKAAKAKLDEIRRSMGL